MVWGYDYFPLAIHPELPDFSRSLHSPGRGFLSGCKCYTCKRWWWSGYWLLAEMRHALSLCLARTSSRPSLSHLHTHTSAAAAARALLLLSANSHLKPTPARSLAPPPRARSTPSARPSPTTRQASSLGCSPERLSLFDAPEPIWRQVFPFHDSRFSSSRVRSGSYSGDGHPQRPSLLSRRLCFAAARGRKFTRGPGPQAPNRAWGS